MDPKVTRWLTVNDLRSRMLQLICKFRSGQDSNPSSRREMEMAEAKFEEAAIWVCWDIDNCPIPKGCKAEEISQKISSALNRLNYRGPISISAYGNMNHIPPSFKKALSSTGVVLNHVHVNSRSFSLHIFDKLLEWSHNPDQPNLMFISRDESLSSYLSEWQAEQHKNVLLAHPPNASDSFVASAKTAWLWNSLCM